MGSSGRRFGELGLTATRARLIGVLSIAAVAPVGCGSGGHTEATSALSPALLAHVRPIGRGPRFDPPSSGPVPGRCRTSWEHALACTWSC
jgi:hypothetical protein